MYTIAEIEDKIVETLKASLSPICKNIGGYYGELEDLVADVTKLTVNTPAIFVLYAGSTFEESANRSYDEDQTFAIIFVAKNLQGQKNLRDTIYPIIDAGKKCLMDNNMGLDIEPLHPQRIDPLVISKIYSIYGMDFKTSFSLN